VHFVVCLLWTGMNSLRQRDLSLCGCYFSNSTTSSGRYVGIELTSLFTLADVTFNETNLPTSL